MSILEKVVSIIQDEVGDMDIDTSKDLLKNYDIDSIALMSIITQIEDEFSIEFEDNDLEKLKSVDDMVALIGSMK